jgi:plasmid stabilization system protein ParE
MSIPAVYLPQAEDDVAVAHATYEMQQAGLGDRFVEAVQDQVDRIRSNPQLYGVFRRDIRAAPLHKFPYVVYYRDRGTDVLVIAVQHGRRSTRAWRGRA